jgi:hypothetical protein
MDSLEIQVRDKIVEQYRKVYIGELHITIGKEVKRE